MKFSICIPNYNYANYIGRTIQSALDQTYPDLEVLVSDNQSTDNSVEVVRAFSDPRIQLRINRCNVGFAGNLDKAGGMASGDFQILLSSDDLMRPDALDVYRRLLKSLGEDASKAVLTASLDIVDPNDQVTGQWQIPWNNVWRESDRVEKLEAICGAPVYRVSADELLRRCLTTMTNPFFFCATAYPRELYQNLEGYGGGRCITPDRWFHWRLLSQAKDAYLVKRNLFAYRIHPSNQGAQQSSIAALKDQVDDYLNSLEIDGAVLKRVGVTRDQVIAAFMEHGIARRALAFLGRGERRRAWRILTYGRACYPQAANRNKKAWLLRALLALGPLGGWVGQRLYKRFQNSPGADSSSPNA